MNTQKTAASAIADKTVEDVIDGRVFGNLSKLVPLVILVTGAVITLVSFWVEGGTAAAAQEAMKTFGVVMGLAGAGSVTAFFGRSQTQLDLQAARAANTVPVPTGSGESVGALPANSGLIHGSWAANGEQDVEPAAPATGDVDAGGSAAGLDRYAL